MNWLLTKLRSLHAVVAIPQVLALIIVIDVAGYFLGLLYWYGPVMTRSSTPVWAWPFIPDCPLFGLLGGLGLMMVTARKYWSKDAQRRAQRWLLIVGGISASLWLSTYLPGMPESWSQVGAVIAVWSWVLLLGGALFRSTPSWLLGLIAFGQIKYGIWTITAWLAFWLNTSAKLGSPLFTFDSVFMTVTHLGLLAQGIFLLTYFRPDYKTAAISFVWFIVSDFVDYGLGFYPAIPEVFIPLPLMQWSTIAMTILLSVWYVWLASRRPSNLHEQPASVIGPASHPTHSLEN